MSSKRRRGMPTKFASEEQMAANFVLQDYDIGRPWKLLSGEEGQKAISGAIEVEEVEIDRDHACLSNRMVLDANNHAFVFVRTYIP